MRTLTYLQHVDELTGVDVHPDTWLDSLAKGHVLKAQSAAIAAKLREGGIDPMRQIDGKVSIVGVFSGQSQEVIAYRNINFLPSVAADNRSPVVKRLDYFAQDKPYLRYLVMTNGARCGIAELRARLCALHRAISAIAAEPQLRAWGITVELRCSEITAERGEDGHWTYHPHANVVVNCSRRLGAEWSDALSWLHGVAPGHWHDNGRLVEAAEAVKYFTKPADIMQHDETEMCRLFVAVAGLKLCQPMNEFRELGKSLKLARLKLSKRLVAGRWEWCHVRKVTCAPKLGDAGGVTSDQVLALLPPQPRFVPRLEPCVLVRNYTGNLAGMLAGAELTPVFAHAKAKWESGGLGFTPSRQLFRRNTQPAGAGPPDTPQSVVFGQLQAAPA